MNSEKIFDINKSTLLNENNAFKFKIYHQVLENGLQLLFTKGLSEIDQSSVKGNSDSVYPFIELYFAVPKYMDIQKKDFNWTIDYLDRISEVLYKNKTWFGPGDTFPTSNQSPPSSINEKFKENYFILSEPMKVDLKLNEEENEVQYLAIIPIFEAEYSYKNSRSAFKLFEQFKSKNLTEVIDEYRGLVAKKKFFGLF